MLEGSLLICILCLFKLWSSLPIQMRCIFCIGSYVIISCYTTHWSQSGQQNLKHKNSIIDEHNRFIHAVGAGSWLSAALTWFVGAAFFSVLFRHTNFLPLFSDASDLILNMFLCNYSYSFLFSVLCVLPRLIHCVILQLTVDVIPMKVFFIRNTVPCTLLGGHGFEQHTLITVRRLATAVWLVGMTGVWGPGSGCCLVPLFLTESVPHWEAWQVHIQARED